ncbi:MAG: hypothetical protein OXI97_08955 [Acidimicrobiaceae bacterium]|nr:hypothetical protein [Acidimicrobiaceae bacterium]
MASVLTPHEWKPPADTDENEPAGGDARPSPFQPQQATVASVLTPHVWKPPADTEPNEPDGASV